MKMHKNFGKWSLQDQEAWLLKKYQELTILDQELRKMLAQVRGKNRINIVEEDYRPDEIILKGL